MTKIEFACFYDETEPRNKYPALRQGSFSTILEGNWQLEVKAFQAAGIPAITIRNPDGDIFVNNLNMIVEDENADYMPPDSGYSLKYDYIRGVFINDTAGGA